MSYQPQHPRLLGVERRAGNLIEHLAERPGPITAHRLFRLRQVQKGLWTMFEGTLIEPFLLAEVKTEEAILSARFNEGELVISRISTGWDHSYDAIELSHEGLVTCTTGFKGTNVTTEFRHADPAHRRQLKVALKTADLLLP